MSAFFMSQEMSLRLECLKLAEQNAPNGTAAEDIVQAAHQFHTFVTGLSGSLCPMCDKLVEELEGGSPEVDLNDFLEGGA